MRHHRTTLRTQGETKQQQMGLVPRTRSQTAAAARLQDKGMSMSSLLQSRSESAVAAPARQAAPPSPLPDIDAADRWGAVLLWCHAPLRSDKLICSLQCVASRVGRGACCPGAGALRLICCPPRPIV